MAQAAKAKSVPAGFSTVTPHLVIQGAAAAIEFYKKALGAEEIRRIPGPGGTLMHAEVKVGNSIVMLCDEFPGSEGWGAPSTLKGTTTALHLYVEDTDALYNRAVAAGAQPVCPPTDMFWGDRYAQINDPFGHRWSIATHQHDYTPEEMQQKMQEAFGGGQQ